MEKKIAIPTRGNMVDDHFGHCESYTIYSVDTEGNVINKESLPSPQGCGCKSNIASVLQQKGVSIMLAGNMGNGAFNVLTNHGITVYRGCSGDVEQLVKQFVLGQINDSGELCHAHGDGHECKHEG